MDIAGWVVWVHASKSKWCFIMTSSKLLDHLTRERLYRYSGAGRTARGSNSPWISVRFLYREEDSSDNFVWERAVQRGKSSSNFTFATQLSPRCEKRRVLSFSCSPDDRSSPLNQKLNPIARQRRGSDEHT